jgi:16S rRNA (uracil1498-N3)-methyltransferase
VSVPRFYVEPLAGPVVNLTEAEARHARQSRRLSAGDPVALFDGRGCQATGRIVTCTPRKVSIAVESVVQIPRPGPQLALAFTPPKGPRQDTLIEKCTELGVAVLQPIETARSVAGASGHRLDKWQRTAIEAAKQTGLAWLPEIRQRLPFEKLLAQLPTYDVALIAVSPGDEKGVRSLLGTEPSALYQQKAPEPSGPGPCSPTPILNLLPQLRDAQRILALIGPEGGWADDEVAGAIAAGARPISLGPNVLRIETAAIALAAAIHPLLYADPT